MDPQQAVEALQTAMQQITAQQQLIADLTLRLSRLESSPPPSQPRRRLPDPVKFAGKFLDTWEPLARAVLRIDQAAIGSEEAQFFWLYGNLDERIQAMVLPQLTSAQEKENWLLDTVVRDHLNLPTEYTAFVDTLHRLNSKGAGTVASVGSSNQARHSSSNIPGQHKTNQTQTPRLGNGKGPAFNNYTGTPASDPMDLSRTSRRIWRRLMMSFIHGQYVCPTSKSEATKDLASEWFLWTLWQPT